MANQASSIPAPEQVIGAASGIFIYLLLLLLLYMYNFISYII